MVLLDMCRKSCNFVVVILCSWKMTTCVIKYTRNGRSALLSKYRTEWFSSEISNCQSMASTTSFFDECTHVIWVAVRSPMLRQLLVYYYISSYLLCRIVKHPELCAVFYTGMLTRPTWHEARESEAEAKEIFRGRGQSVWGRGPVL